MDARDVETVTRLAHPDLEWIPDGRVGEAPVHGRENVIRFFVDRAAMFDEVETGVERIWERGDRVLAFIVVAGRGQASGAPFEIRIGHLWTLRHGVLVRGEGFGDREEARRAAGVPET